jgi:hypothetical protein
MTPDDKDAVLDLARANLTPDELPAIEGRVEAFIRWTDPRNTKPFSGSPLQLVSDLRALLKAYQEQRRALERSQSLLRECLGDYGHRNFTDRYGMADRIRAALTGEDAATLGLSGKTQTDARTRGDG